MRKLSKVSSLHNLTEKVAKIFGDTKIKLYLCIVKQKKKGRQDSSKIKEQTFSKKGR